MKCPFLTIYTVIQNNNRIREHKYLSKSNLLDSKSTILFRDTSQFCCLAYCMFSAIHIFKYFSTDNPLSSTRSLYINRFSMCHKLFRDCTGRQHHLILEYTSESVQQTLQVLRMSHFWYNFLVSHFSPASETYKEMFLWLFFSVKI